MQTAYFLSWHFWLELDYSMAYIVTVHKNVKLIEVLDHFLFAPIDWETMNCVAVLKIKTGFMDSTYGIVNLVEYLKKGDSNESFSNPYVFNGRRQAMGELWCRIEVLQLTQLEEAAILELRSPLWRPLRGPFSNTFWDFNLWLISTLACSAFRPSNMTCLY